MKAGMTDDKPARVPARANQRWHAARIKALLDTESPKVILGDECEKPLPLARDPLTGKPDAGDPPVRFGGRGGALRHPYPYRRKRQPFSLLLAERGIRDLQKPTKETKNLRYLCWLLFKRPQPRCV